MVEDKDVIRFVPKTPAKTIDQIRLELAGKKGKYELGFKLDSILKDYVPYIEYVGGGYYKVSGDKNFFYITDKAGAEEADRLLRLAAENYGK